MTERVAVVFAPDYEMIRQSGMSDMSDLSDLSARRRPLTGAAQAETRTSFTSVKQVNAGMLDIAYA